MKKSVTIDFDGTLTKKEVQQYVKKLIKLNINVCVLTSRYDDLVRLKYSNFCRDNEDLWSIINLLKTPVKNVIFTNMENKSDYLSKTNVLWHLDDDNLSLEDINLNTNTKAIDISSGNWESICDKILQIW